MAEHDRQEQIAGGGTVDQDDARKLAEVRSDLVAYTTRERLGISETIFEATEISEPKSLTNPTPEIGATGPSETLVMDRKHPLHRIEIRRQIYIARGLEEPEEVIERLKAA